MLFVKLRRFPSGLKSFNTHYNDVIMTTMASQITSLTVVYSTVYSDADQRKHQSSASLAFVWGIHRDRWIPRTKDQLRGKCFHLMTSSWSVRLSGERTLSYVSSEYSAMSLSCCTQYCVTNRVIMRPDSIEALKKIGPALSFIPVYPLNYDTTPTQHSKPSNGQCTLCCLWINFVWLHLYYDVTNNFFLNPIFKVSIPVL